MKSKLSQTLLFFLSQTLKNLTFENFLFIPFLSFLLCFLFFIFLFLYFFLFKIANVCLQNGIKISGRNISNLRYTDDTTLMEESDEEINNLLMKVKEESEKDGLKINIQKTKIIASGPMTS